MSKLTLEDIFNNDEFGLLNIKPIFLQVRSEDERFIASFEEINNFYATHYREPQENSEVAEFQLYERLKSIREDVEKIKILESFDIFDLLISNNNNLTTLNEILESDILGLLDDDDAGLVEIKHIKKAEKERSATDFVARRKPCKDFENYENAFKEVHKELKEGKRRLIEFKLENLKQGTYYVNNGILFFVEEINITKKDHYKEDGTRVREDGRTRCIFENGTESNMLKRSIEKLLYENGQVVTENSEIVNQSFNEKFNSINKEDSETGFIYILKSKSEKSKIKEIQNLYKIGFSKIAVEERIKNASQEPTYLMADVRIVMTYKCFNLNPQKLEQLLHNFFGNSCLNIEIYDKVGIRHTPREWFIAPLSVIEQAINLIISEEIVNYKYDTSEEKIVLK